MLPAVSLYTRAVRTTGIDAWTRVLPKLNFSKLFLKLPCKTGSSSRPEETQIPNQNLHVPAPSLSLSPKSPRIQARTGPNQYSPPWVRYFCLGRGPVLDAAPQGSFCEGAGPPAGGNDTFAPKTVGFVGLGNMGSPMAANLLKAGHNLVVHDRNGDAMRALKDKGATSAPSPAELANEVDVVITMLPSAPHVLDVYLGASGLLKERDHIRPTLFIDASTVDPAMCRAVAAAASRCTLASASSPWEGATTSDGPYVVDAPVSGGVPGAQAATLTFMVGGPEKGVELARQILPAMGTRIVHCGSSGSGSAAKLCNNLALAVQMAGVAEGLALGEKLGLDPRLLSQIFNTSTAKSWSSEVYNPVPGVMEGVPASRGYTGGFSASLMAKDLRLALEASGQHGVNAKTPMASAALSVYSDMCVSEAERLDFSGIYQHVYGGGPA